MITQEIKAFLGNMFDRKKVNYLKGLSFITVLFVLTSGAYLSYRWYVYNREQKAQIFFSRYFRDYTMASELNSPAEWERIESFFSAGFNQNSSSYLAPYFLALLADDQIKQGKNDQAIATLAKVIENTSNAAMKQVFIIKKALLQIDSSDEVIQSQGVHDLVEIARSAGSFSDMALFYLGYYYWANNNSEDAKKVWQELADMQWVDKSGNSPWAHEASSMLKQIG